jgi:hypothetical protein
MLLSKFYKTQGDGFQEIGSIGTDGTKLFVRPESPLLSSICQEAIPGPGGEFIEPTDATNFVKNLFLQYKSAYLMATEATEESDNAEGQ